MMDRQKALAMMKARRGDSTLILFHNGNRFEAYGTDAETISKIINIKTIIEDGLMVIYFEQERLDDIYNLILDAGHNACISEMRDESGNFIVNVANDENG